MRIQIVVKIYVVRLSTGPRHGNMGIQNKVFKMSENLLEILGETCLQVIQRRRKKKKKKGHFVNSLDQSRISDLNSYSSRCQLHDAISVQFTSKKDSE